MSSYLRPNPPLTKCAPHPWTPKEHPGAGAPSPTPAVLQLRPKSGVLKTLNLGFPLQPPGRATKLPQNYRYPEQPVPAATFLLTPSPPNPESSLPAPPHSLTHLALTSSSQPCTSFPLARLLCPSSALRSRWIESWVEGPRPQVPWAFQKQRLFPRSSLLLDSV